MGSVLNVLKRKQVVGVRGSYFCGLKRATGVISKGKLKSEVFLMLLSDEGNNGTHRVCVTAQNSLKLQR